MQNAVITLFAVGFILLQVFMGGVRPAYALLCYAILAMAGLCAVRLKPGEKAVLPGLSCLAATATLALYVGFRAWFSPVWALARSDLWMMLAALVVYASFTANLASARERLALIWSFSVFAVVQAAVGVAQLIGQANFMLLPWVFRPDYGFRASGFFIVPDHFAAFLSMLSMFLLSISCWSRGRMGTRVIAFYGFLACILGVAVSGSRSGFISMGVGVFIFATLSLFLVRRFNRPNFLSVAAMTALGLGVIALVAAQFVLRSDIFQARVGQLSDSASTLHLLWNAAKQQYHLSPIMGTGAGTYSYFGRLFRDPAMQGDPQHVHNEYLELLAEYGCIGLGAMGLVVLTHFSWAGRGLRRLVQMKLRPSAWTASNEMALVMGAVCAVVVALVQAVTDFHLHIPANMLLLAFAFAVLGNPTLEPPPLTPKAKTWRWLPFLAPAVSLLLLAFVAPSIYAAVMGESARVALRDGDYEAAQKNARRAIATGQHDPDLYYYLGEAQHYLALQENDTARATALRQAAADAFAKGLKASPEDIRLLLKLARTCDRLGQFEPARAALDRALAADPNLGLVQAYYGLHWHLQRQLARARFYYKKAQELGEKVVSTAGLKDLTRDEAVAAEIDAFGDIMSEAGGGAIQPAAPAPPGDAAGP